MSILSNVNPTDVVRIAKDGSPLLLQAIGRIYGIGPEERKSAFGSDPGGGVPAWAWATLALGAGLVVGIRVYRKWPQVVPKIVSGE